MAKSISETDLAGPLYGYLADAGYTVRSEVKDCDIAAVKGGDLLIIELKKSLNLALLVQGVRRQRLTDIVYLAIPRPSNKWKWWKESRGAQHLLRRLELGLILVSLDHGKPPVEVVFHPLPFSRRKRAGSTRRKLATAYRENAIHIACCLMVTGRTSPAALRAMGTGPKTLSILRFNAYGWFERVDRGVYGLAAHAAADFGAWPELRKRYMAAARRAARKAGVSPGGAPAALRARPARVRT